MAAHATGSADATRLDVWLTRERSITRHAAQTMIDAGLVTVNGRPGRAGQRVREHDVVAVAEVTAGATGAGGDERGRTPARAVESGPRVERVSGRSTAARATGRGHAGVTLERGTGGTRSSAGPAAPTVTEAPTSAPINIVYEDDWLAVVDKPAGMVVHPAPGHPQGTLADALRERGTTWSLLGGEERAGIVHRLDRDTSGLLIVAKTESAHRALAEQLRNRTLGRTYWALVHGGFREETGTIDAPIGRDPRNRKRMAIVDNGRAAVSDFRVVERLGTMSVLEVSLRSWRTHQIRVHLAYIGHPVVGDELYGRGEPKLGRPALHATRLKFIHPSDGSSREYESLIPEALLTFADEQRRLRR
jgi:23S rRNA pseudouridine1911/1915/1917 synthase